MIIPAYNEEEAIYHTIVSVDRYLKGFAASYEILVINDGSQDRTREYALQAMQNISSTTLIDTPRNMGKGYAVREGMLRAKGRYIFFIDADLFHPLSTIQKMLPYLEGQYEMVIGSRAMSGLKGSFSFSFRHIAGRIFNLLVRFLLVKGFLDTQCGFKGFRYEVARELFPRITSKGFGFDVELLLLAQKRRLNIGVVPVAFSKIEGTHRSSKVRLIRDSMFMFLDVWRIFFRNVLGRYDVERSGAKANSS